MTKNKAGISHSLDLSSSYTTKLSNQDSIVLSTPPPSLNPSPLPLSPFTLSFSRASSIKYTLSLIFLRDCLLRFFFFFPPSARTWVGKQGFIFGLSHSQKNKCSLLRNLKGTALLPGYNCPGERGQARQEGWCYL